MAWRLSARQFSGTSLSGIGAGRVGGRWNLPGTRVVYCAGSLSLAAMERLVHVESFDDLEAFEWMATALTIPGSAIEQPARFPRSWREYPYSVESQRFGSAWAGGQRSLALRVPSVVIPGEFNYLLNPAHPDIGSVTVAAPVGFRFDPRLGTR
jgi:RES domain-containing protein